MKGSPSELWDSVLQVAGGLEHEVVDPNIRQLRDTGNNGLAQSTGSGNGRGMGDLEVLRIQRHQNLLINWMGGSGREKIT